MREGGGKAASLSAAPGKRAFAFLPSSPESDAPVIPGVLSVWFLLLTCAHVQMDENRQDHVLAGFD